MQQEFETRQSMWLQKLMQELHAERRKRVRSAQQKKNSKRVGPVSLSLIIVHHRRQQTINQAEQSNSEQDRAAVTVSRDRCQARAFVTQRGE